MDDNARCHRREDLKIFLILACIVIWSAIFIFYWRKPLYIWFDNKFDLERFRRIDKENNNS